MKFVELIWMCKHKEKARSNQASISINSCTELSKTQLFPVIIIKEKIIFPFYVMFGLVILRLGGKTVSWKMKSRSYFPNHDTLIRTLYYYFYYPVTDFATVKFFNLKSLVTIRMNEIKVIFTIRFSQFLLVIIHK